jgi:hypothetical protein
LRPSELEPIGEQQPSGSEPRDHLRQIGFGYGKAALTAPNSALLCDQQRCSATLPHVDKVESQCMRGGREINNCHDVSVGYARAMPV